MPFPNPPFTLNENDQNGDRLLLTHLQSSDTFSYLSDGVRQDIANLAGRDDVVDFRSMHEKLVKLWPQILTDALLELKKHDKREWGQSGEQMGTFFDAHSLGTEELKEILTGFSEFEGMLYGASPDRYRDHVAHSFRVWIAGHGILSHCFGGTLYIPECLPADRQIANREWACMWAIAALCHDIGYPLSAIEKINARTRRALRTQGLVAEGDLRFVFSQQMLPFHETMIKTIASSAISSHQSSESHFVTHLQNKYWLKFLKSFDRLDHGIVSAMLLSRSLVYFLESDLLHDSAKSMDTEDARQFLIRREILRAVAAHTCQDIYHLRFDTLSFLLYMVDEIQCWGRPTLEELQHEPTNIEEGWATVQAFGEDNVDVTISTRDPNWDTSLQISVLNQVLKLRRMLRLAVGTQDLLTRRLVFEVHNQNQQMFRLELAGGKIHLRYRGISPDLIESVPMLRNIATESAVNSPL